MSREQRYKNYQLHREKGTSSKPTDDIFALPEEDLAGNDSKYQDNFMYKGSKNSLTRMIRKQKKLKPRDTWS